MRTRHLAFQGQARASVEAPRDPFERIECLAIQLLPPRDRLKHGHVNALPLVGSPARLLARLLLTFARRGLVG